MRFTLPVLSSIATMACMVISASAQPVERMGWLAGCWRGQFGEPGTVEQWLQPAGGTMLGMSRTIKSGKTVEYEFMQLVQQNDGVLAFVPQPSGRPPTTFRLARMGQFEAVFENAEHDFPQRIAYARPEETQLRATIEGTRNGAMRSIEFRFVRVACEATTTREIR